ncbi:MAG: diacylglycerol kinase family protein [Deltaproteobacteria bacterium]|nr:diacylglycerol kinase family protein [Deltaproteobacteria bacterium]
MIAYLQRRISSFACAIKGAAFLIRSQPHARIHLAATGAVFVLGLALNLQRLEWCLLIIAIIIVWVAEGMNTALEAIADAVHPAHHPLIGRAKDVAAAAVLISAVGAVLIGILIFGNHVKVWF